MPQKKAELEYYLKIFPYADERKGERGHVFELTTVKEFKTFKYDIIVDINVEDNTIYFTIHGISTPQFSIPEHGPANFRKTINNLRGTYSIVVSKLNGPQTTYTVNFTPKKTVLKGRAKRSFIQLETTHKE